MLDRWRGCTQLQEECLHKACFTISPAHGRAASPRTSIQPKERTSVVHLPLIVCFVIYPDGFGNALLDYARNLSSRSEVDVDLGEAARWIDIAADTCDVDVKIWMSGDEVLPDIDCCISISFRGPGRARSVPASIVDCIC